MSKHIDRESMKTPEQIDRAFENALSAFLALSEQAASDPSYSLDELQNYIVIGCMTHTLAWVAGRKVTPTSVLSEPARQQIRKMFDKLGEVIHRMLTDHGGTEDETGNA